MYLLCLFSIPISYNYSVHVYTRVYVPKVKMLLGDIHKVI